MSEAKCGTGVSRGRYARPGYTVNTLLAIVARRHDWHVRKKIFADYQP
jgi:hypothetical protein